VETAEICRKSGKLAIPGVCSSDPRGSTVYTEYFAKGTVPTEVCNNHVRVTVCATTGLLPDTYCPKTTQIRMALPADAEGSTDDSAYAMPTRRCPGHLDTTIPSIGSDGPDFSAPGGENTPPGSNPLPVGPGYVSPGSSSGSSPGSGAGYLPPDRDRINKFITSQTAEKRAASAVRFSGNRNPELHVVSVRAAK